MAVIVVGINHRGASVELRERAAYQTSEGLEAVNAVRERAHAREGIILSTCNRTELYMVEGDDDAAPSIWNMLSDRIGEDSTALGYVRRDREAVAHLFRVASGLDSMVLGEAQIQGQVRDAWESCRSQSGPILNRLFQTALLVAGRVRTETSISRGAASVSSAAVQLAKKIFGSLSGRRAMVVGAGEMAELALECLTAEGVQTATVANRTFERATALAARYGGVAMHLDACWDTLSDVDLLLCSTAAPRPIVTKEQVLPSLHMRRDRPLCILDIALPRDVDPAVGTLDNVFLYNLDDLQSVIAANLERRRADMPSAEDLIADEVERYWEWVAGLVAVPVVTQFRAEMDRLRERELRDAMRRLKNLSPDEQAAVEHLSRALMNKFLHEPTVRLRAAAANGRGLGIVDAARYLFGLDAKDHEGTVPTPDGSTTHQENE